MECRYCKKKLRLIKMDWTARRYHKKCYEIKQFEEAAENFVKDYQLNQHITNT
jgi:hypothetical protein